jgi:hypothetical protein
MYGNVLKLLKFVLCFTTRDFVLKNIFLFIYIILHGAGTLPDSASPATADDENGLPSPPFDVGAFLATQTTSIEISQVVFKYVCLVCSLPQCA